MVEKILPATWNHFESIEALKSSQGSTGEQFECITVDLTMCSCTNDGTSEIIVVIWENKVAEQQWLHHFSLIWYLKWKASL